MATVELEDVGVVKGGSTLLTHVDLAVADGELLAIVGPSGSGKTTLLRAIAGLDALVSGVVRIGGLDQADERVRDIGMVFQDNVLFPNMNVEQNVAFPLEVRKVPTQEVKDRVWAEGRALHIDDLMARDPKQLSAGHQQLVQIARAMVRAPDAFLMDEPLARLDAKLRIHMRGELKMIQRGYGVTTLYVTNDPVEAMSMADRIAVMEAGAIIQVDAPSEVYLRPRTVTVAELMGAISLFDVAVEPAADGSWLAHPGFKLRSWAPALDAFTGQAVKIGVRPEDVEVADVADFVATVRSVEHLGASHEATVEVAGDRLLVRVRGPMLRSGDSVRLRIARYMVFDPATGLALPT
ncbi:MAG TPA: ABC transporter ATP-binding protein [Acidimicrobiia bacterium]|nr:ABC transporter ATP-binding protein [Acidimicrobiia bacterium]